MLARGAIRSNLMTTKQTQPRPLSFYLALGAALLCLIAVGIIFVRALTAPAATTRRTDDQAFGSGEDPDDFLGKGARGLHIQIMDRDDRSRLSAELRTETIEPLMAQRYRVTLPRATLYLEDGRVVHISAEDGTLVMPDRSKPPETGTLKGNVVVRHFDTLPSGRQPDPDHDTPTFLWRGSTLSFDSTLGEASTNEPFVLTSNTFEFKAADAKLLINQALERLERFTVRKGGTLVYFAEPTTPEPTDDRDTNTNTPTLAHTDGTPTNQQAAYNPSNTTLQPAHEPVVTFYQGAMRDDIVLERAGQRIASDRLDIFARTIDNKLPEGAIASFAPPQTETQATPTETTPDASDSQDSTQPDSSDNTDTPTNTPTNTPTEIAQADTNESPPLSEDATLSWTGVLDIRPLSAEPPELEEDHIAARFTSESSGVVSFSDALSQASGQAAVVEYAMTTQHLVLSGPSQERSVFITSPTIGEATMGRFELPLATGYAHIPGPFSVIAADGISRVDCREQANLLFAVRDGRLTGELLEVMCLGSARAADADASLEADFLHAFFQSDDTGNSRLRRLIAKDSIRLSDGHGAGGTCDDLDVTFDPEAKDPTPATVDATGNVRFRDQAAKIDAHHLYVNLRKTEDGNIEVAKAWADGDVLFRKPSDQIEITSNRLFVDADADYIEIEDEGGQARIVREQTVITGELVRLNGSLRTAYVQGPGSFEHRAGKGDQASHILASWTEGMAFDDATGQLECLGDVYAINEPDPLTKDTITAALVRVQLDPAIEPTTTADSTEDPLELEAVSDDDRAIRTVYAAGRAYFGVGDELATIESARYAEPSKSTPEDNTDTPTPEPVLERAFRLSGVEIFSDNLAGTLDVPGRGRLFVADLRPESKDQDDSSERGAALFDWLGSLHADRTLGTAEMHSSVQMNHTRTSDSSRAMLEAQRLRINFAPSENDTTDNIFSGLRSAIADTNVYLRTDTRELTADLLEYNPDTGLARALADGSSLVRILDRATGSPTTASAIIWNLTTDRVDIVDPSTITILR